jgi:hypothetical protein
LPCVNADLKLLCVENVQERKKQLRLHMDNIISEDVKIEVKKFSENEIKNIKFQLN